MVATVAYVRRAKQIRCLLEAHRARYHFLVLLLATEPLLDTTLPAPEARLFGRCAGAGASERGVLATGGGEGEGDGEGRFDPATDGEGEIADGGRPTFTFTRFLKAVSMAPFKSFRWPRDLRSSYNLPASSCI